MSWTGIDFSFKTLINKATTSSSKQHFEEEGAFTINTHLDEVWTRGIPSDPSQAVSQGVAQLYTQYVLTEETSVGSQQCYSVRATPGNLDSARLGNWISDKYGSEFQVLLYQNNGTQIYPTDPSIWMFNYQTGIFTFNGSTAAFTKPFKITAYRYIGGIGITGLSNFTGVFGTTGSQGVTGIQGLTGILGIDGNTGVAGNTGLVGLANFIDSTGYPAIDGTAVIPAVLLWNQTDGALFAGITGLNWIQISAGSSQGTTGIRGLVGNTGLVGATGIVLDRTGYMNFSVLSSIGSVSTGLMGQSTLAGNSKFNSWTVFTDVTSSVKIDVQKTNYADYPNSASLHGSTGIFTLNTIKNTGSTNYWSGTTGAAGDILRVFLSGTDSSASKVSVSIGYSFF